MSPPQSQAGQIAQTPVRILKAFPIQTPPMSHGPPKARVDCMMKVVVNLLENKIQPVIGYRI
jgi:hypothetical protein